MGTLIFTSRAKQVACFAAALAVQMLLAGGTATAQDVNYIVAKMVAAHRINRAQHTAYEVVRNYQIFKADHPDDASHVTVEVDFLPPGEKTFKIMDSSGGMVEHVVRKSLEHEVELTQDPSEAEYSPSNYDFALVGQEMVDGNRCYVLQLKPKRESKDLMTGHAWVDAKTFLIRKIEGEPSKSLSFWLKDVHLVFNYRDVDGMWLRTASRATAHVRFSGDMNLISRDVDFHPLQNGDVASAAPAPTFRQTRYAQPKTQAPVAANYR